MKKKGFTLIELLAVIIVLTIIALISTPIIFNVIENAKLKALENSSYGVIDAVRTQYAENLLNSNDGTVILTGEAVKLTVAGEQPIAGTWTIDNTKNSDERGIKIVGLKFASMKDYTCTNFINGKIESKITCTKDNGSVVTGNNLKSMVLGTNNSNIVTSGDGLYSQTTNNGTTYYFKGAVENNYIKFADKLFRIVRINEDGTIRIITQDSVITEQVFNSTYNTYDKMYYTNSELKTAVDDWFTTNITGENASKVVSGNYFCEQAKVVWDKNFITGSAKVVTALEGNYTPTFECTTDGNGKGVINSNVGLITIDELLYAGVVFNPGISNSYIMNGSYFWTMSPAGLIDNCARDWIGGYNDILGGPFFAAYDARPVINLNANVTVTGSGTETDPYIVK